MELKLNKKKLKNLSRDHLALPANLTPQVGGGAEQGDGPGTGPSLCTQYFLQKHTGPSKCTVA